MRKHSSLWFLWVEKNGGGVDCQKPEARQSASSLDSGSSNSLLWTHHVYNTSEIWSQRKASSIIEALQSQDIPICSSFKTHMHTHTYTRAHTHTHPIP